MTKLYYKLINSFVEDIEFIDGVGDFRLLSQRAVKAMSSLKEYNRFSKGLFEWIGYNTKNLYISKCRTKRVILNGHSLNY